MFTVLVTGGAGYLASVLIRRLLSDMACVIAVDNLMYKQYSAILPFLNDSNYEFHHLDVRDTHQLRPLVARADVIIPLAALVGMPLCQRNPDDAWSTNEFAIRDLMKLVSPNQRIISPNSNSGYGRAEFADENTKMKPLSIYAQSKLNAERYVLDAGGVSLRLATLFGTSVRQRNDLLVNDLTCKLYYNHKITIFEADAWRNYIHVEDAARAFIHFMDGNHWNVQDVFNCGNTNLNAKKIDLALNIAAELELPASSVSVDDSQSDPDQRNYRVSNKKLEDTGFTCLYSLADGVKSVRKMCEVTPKEVVNQMRNG